MKTILLVFAFMLATLSAFSQTRATSELHVYVADQSGAVIASASVTITNPQTGFTRTAATNTAGDAAFTNLPLTGFYDVTATASGFSPAKQTGIRLSADNIAQARIKLAVSSEHATVTVTGTANTVNATTAQLGSLLSAEELNETPVLSRKLSTAALLDSSVRSARGTGDLFLGQTLIVVNGSGRRQTTYSVDDVTGNDTWGRQTLFTAIPFSAVQEFEIIRNPVSSEYGWTAGSAINIVTRSGTNTLHGDFIGLWRPTQLEANNPLSVQKTGDKLAQGSGTLSGPIIKDHTHFLVSEEYSSDDRGATILSPLALNTTYVGHATSELFLGRLDHQINNSNQFSLRANLDRLRDTNPQDAVAGLSLPSTGRIFRRNTYAVAASLNSAISNTLANNARVQFQLGSPITQFTPVSNSTQFSYPGFATIGNSQYASLINHQYEAADTLTKVLGRHTIEAGIDLIQSSSGGFGTEFGGGFLLGQFQVKPSANGKQPSQLTINDVSRFTQTFGNQQYNSRDLLGAVFLQDNWRATQNLNLELGLRYDAESFTDARKNFAPRIGFAYKLPGSSTVVRASYGIFYSEVHTNLAASDKINGPQGTLTFSAAPGQFGFPTSLAALPAFPPGAVLPPRDITVRAGQRAYLSQFFNVGALRFYPDALLNPYTQQWTTSVEQDLGLGWLLTLDYLGLYTQKIERPVDLNAPSLFVRTAPGQVRSAAAADATRPITPVPNGYRIISATINQGQAWYDGLQVDVRKRFSRRFTTLLSYTWSHTINTVEADATGLNPNDNNQLGAFEKATSLLDQRHRASLSGTYSLPWGFEFSSWITAGSSRPFNATTGVDNNGDGSNTDRPVVNGVVVPRNYGQGTPTYDVAASFGKTIPLGERFHLNLRASGFNLTNHLNIVGRNGVYGNNATPNATFGAPNAGISNVDPARQFEFQARITF